MVSMKNVFIVVLFANKCTLLFILFKENIFILVDNIFLLY